MGKIRTDVEKSVSAALAKDDFKAAGAAVERLVPVPVYAIAIDDAMKSASKAAIEQSISSLAAGKVVSAAQKQLNAVISPRPENIQDEELLKAYFTAVAELTDYVYQPNWEMVQKSLDKTVEALVTDDISQEDAKRFADCILADYMAIFDQTAHSRLPTLTTQKLNENIAELKIELSSRISKALAAKMKAAMTAPKGGNAKKFEELALQAAARAARDVDFDTRINGFVDAVSDRVEPSVNRVLGDGARVLRLLQSGAKIEKDDATSLLVAATYMGFEEVMHYALILGADVNGHSAKDDLARSPLLIVLQYGCKGQSAKILSEAGASLQARDARERGVVHYAVLGLNNDAVVALLRKSIDVKAADKDGVTPLILAADHGYSTLLRMLIPFSEINAKDNDGFSALLRAAEDGRADLVRILISSGADVKQHSNEGDGLIELAAAANAPELLVYLLDEKKFSPTERCTAQLVIAGNVPTLQQMIAHGAKVEDKHLAVAIKLGDFEMVKYLVSQGMDVNADCVKKVSPPEACADAVKITDFLYAQGQRK